MQKIILIVILILTIGCHEERVISLNNDPIVKDYFNSNEIQELVKILDFFENQIAISKDSINITDPYKSFFRKLTNKMDSGDMNLNISFDDQKIFFECIDPQLFTEIWYYRTDYNPILKDSTTSIHYEWKGKYFDFLLAVSEMDESIEGYFKDFTASGDISPAVLAHSMMDYQKYDLNFERIRLIIAINYLTYNELLRLMESQ